jgi:hypothetical protein
MPARRSLPAASPTQQAARRHAPCACCAICLA